MGRGNWFFVFQFFQKRKLLRIVHWTQKRYSLKSKMWPRLAKTTATPNYYWSFFSLLPQRPILYLLLIGSISISFYCFILNCWLDISGSLKMLNWMLALTVFSLCLSLSFHFILINNTIHCHRCYSTLCLVVIESYRSVFAHTHTHACVCVATYL